MFLYKILAIRIIFQTEMSTSVTQPVRPVHYEGSVQSSVNPQAMDTVIDNYQPQSMAMLPESMSDRLNELHQKMHQLESCFGAEDRDAEVCFVASMTMRIYLI